MANTTNVPQVPLFDFNLFQVDLHLGFSDANAYRVNAARWADETHTTKLLPEKLDELAAAYLQKVNAEDNLYKPDNASDVAQLRKEKDRERDVLFRNIRRVVFSAADTTIFPTKQEKALLIKHVIQHYDVNPDVSLDAQTIATDQWLQEQLENYQLILAARELDLTESIAQLKTINDEIKQLTRDLSDENQSKVPSALQQARKETDQAFRQFATMLNAYALTADEPYQFIELIRGITANIEHYRTDAEQRREVNRRISVKSELVGNHLYDYSAGWTWAQLVQQYPKAFFLQVVPDGQGGTVTHIASADKKALKAGGLIVCLESQPVLADDVLDVNKTYYLEAQ
jgi:hypothetical protein